MNQFLFLVLFMITSSFVYGQSLDHFLWKNRLLIINTPDLKDPNFEKQLKVFESQQEALKERKLLIIYIQGDRFLTANTSDKQWKRISSKSDLERFQQDSFTAYLIGLDGEVKMKSTDIIKAKRIFDKIDSMPMRRAEMRKVSKSNL